MLGEARERKEKKREKECGGISLQLVMIRRDSWSSTVSKGGVLFLSLSLSFSFYRVYYIFQYSLTRALRLCAFLPKRVEGGGDNTR